VLSQTKGYQLAKCDLSNWAENYATFDNKSMSKQATFLACCTGGWKVCL
jgi:hypothetical protein